MRQAGRALLTRMLLCGGGIWLILFVLATLFIALPFLARIVSPDFQQGSILHFVAPTGVAGLVIVAGLTLIIARWCLARGWLTYTLAGLGGFVLMAVATVFVAMPDIVWQLACALSVAAAAIAAGWVGRSADPAIKASH